MAVIHPATLVPSKAEMAAAWLDVATPLEPLGGYRIDDPAGEVGVEGLLLRTGQDLLHLPVTYRAAPLEGGELVTTMDHSTLGDRWVYTAASDPVAQACFRALLHGEVSQAVMEVHHEDGTLEIREPGVRVSVRTGTPGEPGLRFTQSLVEPASGGLELLATWEGGSGVVAALD